MAVKQLTVLTGSTVFDLNSVLSHLGAAGIDIRAHCLVDNGDGHCKLRMIVSDPLKASALLQDQRLATVVTDVVLTEVDDKPGGLSRILDLLAEEELQIEYSYTAVSEAPGNALMVFRFSDNPRAVAVMEASGLKVLGT
jgi:hypothetical protein